MDVGADGSVWSMVTVVAERARPFEPSNPVATAVTEPSAVSSKTYELPKVKLAYPKSKFVAVELVMLINKTDELFLVFEAEKEIAMWDILIRESSFADLVEILIIPFVQVTVLRVRAGEARAIDDMSINAISAIVIRLILFMIVPPMVLFSCLKK